MLPCRLIILSLQINNLHGISVCEYKHDKVRCETKRDYAVVGSPASYYREKLSGMGAISLSNRLCIHSSFFPAEIVDSKQNQMFRLNWHGIKTL
jgi:hypothetical protein